MKKLILAFILFGAVCSVNAQFRIDNNYPTAGISVVTDSINAKRSVKVHFNTDKALTVPGGTAQKATTARGVQVKVYNELDQVVSAVDSKSENYGSNGNPIHISNVDSVLNFYTAKNVPAWSSTHNFWKPANCVFDIDPSDLTNQALGVYPGIYKKVDLRLYFSFDGLALTSDLEFDVLTLNAGNTTKTASYKLMVSIGSDKTSISATDGKTPDYTVTDFYVTGSGVKHVKLAELLGVNPSVFTNKKVYIALFTTGTGTSIQSGIYDPVIAVDNFNVDLGLAKWVNPAIGAFPKATETIDNAADPVKNIKLENNDLIFPLYLSTADRIGNLTIVNDLDGSGNHNAKDFSFLATEGVFAKDAEGKYTIPVTYTYTQDVMDGAGTWSKEQIAIAGTGTAVSDDICVYLKYTKKEADVTGTLVTDKIELNCGPRFWYNFFGEVDLTLNSVSPIMSNNLKIYSQPGRIVAENAVNPLNVYNLNGQVIKVILPEEAQTGVSVASGVYLVGEKSQTAVKVSVN